MSNAVKIYKLQHVSLLGGKQEFWIREIPTSMTHFEGKYKADMNWLEIPMNGSERNIQDVLKTYQTVGGWQLITEDAGEVPYSDIVVSDIVIYESNRPNAPQSNVKHKCRCDWNIVYCYGCKCNGV